MDKERKTMEEERKTMEEERKTMEEERKTMEEERKTMEEERNRQGTGSEPDIKHSSLQENGWHNGQEKDRHSSTSSSSSSSSSLNSSSSPSSSHESMASDRLNRELHNPQDTGWSWVILFSVLGNQFVINGLFRAFGVLLVAIQVHFKSSATQVAVLGGVECACFSLTAWLTLSMLLEMTSVRCVTLLGSFVGACGLAVSYLATNTSHLIVSFAVSLGVAIGMTGVPGFVLLTSYFKNKLPLAIALANTGASIGGVVMPIASRLLLDEFFLPGAMLFLSGVLAQNLVFGSLLTPPSDYEPAPQKEGSVERRDDVEEATQRRLSPEEKRVRATERQRLRAKEKRLARSGTKAVSESEAASQKRIKGGDLMSGGHPLARSLQAVTSEQRGPQNRAGAVRGLSGSSLGGSRGAGGWALNGGLVVTTCGLAAGSHALSLASLHLQPSSSSLSRRKQSQKRSHWVNVSVKEVVIERETRFHGDDKGSRKKKKTERNAGCGGGGGGGGGGNSTDDGRQQERPFRTRPLDDIEDDDDSPSSGCCRGGWRNVARGLCDPILLRSPVLWVMMAYHYTSALACALPVAFLPFLAYEKGLSATQGALLVTVSGALDILSRLLPGLLVQSKLMKAETTVAVSLLVVGLLFQFTGLADGMAAMTLVSVVMGLFSGVFFSMIPLVIIDLTDPEHFRPVLGVVNLAIGISGVTAFPFVGYLKEVSGSYVSSFHLMGGAGLLACFLLCLLPALRRWEEAARTASSKTSTTTVL